MKRVKSLLSSPSGPKSMLMVVIFLSLSFGADTNIKILIVSNYIICYYNNYPNVLDCDVMPLWYLNMGEGFPNPQITDMCERLKRCNFKHRKPAPFISLDPFLVVFLILHEIRRENLR